jgi:hypothetical protein
VKFVEPVQPVCDQKISDFVATVIKNQRSPVPMFPLPRIGMLEKMGAVEQRQAVRIFREMARYPVDDDADAVLMAAIHKMPEFIRIAKAARRGEVAGHLVTPGTVKRMLCDRQ